MPKLLLLFLFFGGATDPDSTTQAQARLHSQSPKITFDLSRISPAGLVGPPDGLRSVSYEFCIPASAWAEVQAIDPTLQPYPGSRGRIGCRDQTLCIGTTSNPRWREILQAIAALEFVDRIDEFVGE
jgi:hypothetical protein